MAKYRMQFTVSVEVAKEVTADSLEAAFAKANEIAKADPIHAKLIVVPKRSEYLWDNETTVRGVTVA